MRSNFYGVCGTVILFYCNEAHGVTGFPSLASSNYHAWQEVRLENGIYVTKTFHAQLTTGFSIWPDERIVYTVKPSRWNRDSVAVFRAGAYGACDYDGQHLVGIPPGMLLGIPFFIAWLKGGMGGRDVKLVIVIGLYLGFYETLVFFLSMVPVITILIIHYWNKSRNIKRKSPLAWLIV